jgi:predicted DNA-binding protein
MQDMSAKDISYTMRMSEEKRAELQRLADADKRSLANYIDIVLDKHLEDARRREKLTHHTGSRDFPH